MYSISTERVYSNDFNGSSSPSPYLLSSNQFAGMRIGRFDPVQSERYHSLVSNHDVVFCPLI